MLKIYSAIAVATIMSAALFARPADSAGGGKPAAAASPGASAAAPAAAPAPAAPAANTITGGFAGIIHTRHPTLYIVSLAPDVQTATAIAVETAMKLTHYRSSAYQALDPNYQHHEFHQQECADSCYPAYPGKFPTSIWLIPQPTWAVQDYVNQCVSDPADTVGAIVVTAVENDNGARNFIGWADYYYRLFGDAFFVTCEPHSSNEWEATGTDKAATKPQITSSTSSVTEQTTEAAQDKSWQKTTTVSPYPTPTGSSVSSSTTTSSWAHARPSISKSTSVTYAAVPMPTPTPNMTVIWDANSNIYGHAAGGLWGGGVPLLTIAGVAGYYASRTQTVTTSSPSGCGNAMGLKPCLSTTATTIPTISPGFALLATGLSGLGTITVPGTNPTPVLKRAAASLAQSVYDELARACGDSIKGQDPDMDWMCQNVFDLSAKQKGP